MHPVRVPQAMKVDIQSDVMIPHNCCTLTGCISISTPRRALPYATKFKPFRLLGCASAHNLQLFQLNSPIRKMYKNYPELSRDELGVGSDFITPHHLCPFGERA